MTDNTGGRAIMLTGPPLAGKTSTAVRWADSREHTTAWLDWDQLRNTLFSTRLQEQIESISDQYRFAATIASATAHEVTATGADIVIAAARVPTGPNDPPEWLGLWDDLDMLDPITIVLLPSVETRLDRLRRNPGHPFGEEQVRETHALAWEAWREGVPARPSARHVRHDGGRRRRRRRGGRRRAPLTVRAGRAAARTTRGRLSAGAS